MIPEYFAIIGGLIASLGGFYYFYQTLRGKVQPNRVTWLLWGLFPMIIFIAQRTQGVDDTSWVSFLTGLTPLLVVTASFFNKKAYWKTAPRDYILMVAALIGIVLWVFTKEPNLAILITLLADLCAGIPTIIKSLKHPETESWLAYAISAFGLAISVISIHDFSFQNAAFVLYIFAMNTALTLICLRGNWRRRKVNTH